MGTVISLARAQRPLTGKLAPGKCQGD